MLKKFYVLTVLALGLLNFPLMAQEAETEGDPVFTAKIDTYDYGKVPAGDTVRYVFHFVNTGDADLIIDRVKPSCSCTVPTFPDGPIAPGGTGEIEAVFDTKGKEGEQDRELMVMYNGSARISKLFLKGFVTEPRIEIEAEPDGNDAIFQIKDDSSSGNWPGTGWN